MRHISFRTLEYWFVMHIHGSQAVVDGILKEHVCIQTSLGLIQRICFDCDDSPDLTCFGTLIPGFVDIHSHGGGGYYFSDVNLRNIETARNVHLNHGTTTQIASLITAPMDVLKEQILRLVPMIKSKMFAGIHLEGPYLSRARCGAHEPSFLRSPNINELKNLIDIGQGYISMVTLAPELDGSIEAIEFLSSRGVTVALGHSQADEATTLSAINAGAKVITHFSNGMPKPGKQIATIAEVALTQKSIYLEIIMDGIHVSEDILYEVLASGNKRTILITDSMSAAGSIDGNYIIGSMDVVVKDGVARLTQNNSLAGSTLTMDRAFTNFFALNHNLAECVFASSTLPAQILGLDSVGSISIGKIANLLEYIDSKISIIPS